MVVQNADGSMFWGSIANIYYNHFEKFGGSWPDGDDPQMPFVPLEVSRVLPASSEALLRSGMD